MDAYIDEDMRSQIEAAQKNSTLLIQNEMNYLKRLTASMALALSKADIRTDEDILQTLEEYADASNIVRTLFITLDGQAYTSYAGYVGQDSKDTSIDGILLTEITEPIFSQPYYAEDLDEVIFGVVAPVTMGEKQGVLVSSYNIKEFSKLLENKFISGSADIGIVNSRGEVVSGYTADQFNLNIFDVLNGIPFESSSAQEMRSDFADGRSGFSVYSVDGISRYCVYAPVELNDWFVVMTVKEITLRSKLTNLERYGFWLAVELVGIMLWLLCVIIASRRREQKKIRTILEQAAMIDGLTGIYNRKATEDMIEKSLQTSTEHARAALLVLDLDDFKKINDQGGHLLGDKVLKEWADRLNSLFGDEGIVGRIGGDEFVVFLQDVRNIKQVEEQVNRLIHHFYVTNDNGEKQKISVSVGIAQTGPEADSFLLLYQMADAALYRAKQTGKAKLSN